MGLEDGLMSQGEARRLVVIQAVMRGVQVQADAARALGLSVRQVKRLCRAVRQSGPAGLISRRRGRPSNRRVPHEERCGVMALVRQHYADFGPQLASEQLAREHGFGRSVETLRRWMIEDGLWQPRQRRAKRWHPPRPRRACRGELVQIDGSHHDWFEARSPRCCLIAFIDDATGQVLQARFFDQETTQGYLQLLHALVQRDGAPLALYSDRHGIFTKADPEDLKPTQFERALMQLHIEPICARSPQAKGRVERLFQTLQDRLCKAMRLAGIDSAEQANRWLAAYLGEHNGRFAVVAQQPQDMHRPWRGSAQALADICSLHHQRQLSAQGACKFAGRVPQLLPGQTHAPKARAMIDIAQHGDGSVHLSYRGKPLAHHGHGLHEPLPHRAAADAKTVHATVDKACQAHLSKLQRLRAELAFQDSQRQRGIYRPDSPPIVPPRSGAGRSGSSRSQAA